MKRKITAEERDKLRLKRKTHAKFIYVKLCRMGKYAVAQRVLCLLQYGKMRYFGGDSDWEASLHLNRENVFGNSIAPSGNSELFWL